VNEVVDVLCNLVVDVHMGYYNNFHYEVDIDAWAGNVVGEVVCDVEVEVMIGVVKDIVIVEQNIVVVLEVVVVVE
jgi:hypothetical protein